jgi:hypothetical protein
MNAGQRIAEIALAIPEQPTSGDVLRALSAAYNAGAEDTTEKLARGILRGGPAPRGLKAQAL